MTILVGLSFAISRPPRRSGLGGGQGSWTLEAGRWRLEERSLDSPSLADAVLRARPMPDGQQGCTKMGMAGDGGRRVEL